MYLRALVAALSLLVPSPVATASVPHTEINPGAIVQVICPVTGGYSMGTAFRVGNGLMLSVKHVTAPGTCTIDGKAITVSYTSSTKDFSMIVGDAGPSLKIDCGGFVVGHHYLALGYARGAPFQTTVELVALGKMSGDFAMLSGILTVIPGQSGGPIVDADSGAVVGLVNVYDFPRGLSGSVPLRDTPVCAGKIA